jgi:hypothetical protein
MRRFFFGLAALCLASASPLRAQDAVVDVPLQEFVQQVAKLWQAGNVDMLVELFPAEDQLTLDTGSGIETANSRHAAAALRALFAQRESVGTRAVRVTLASPSPPRGFGELTWTFRIRGAPGQESRSVYVATVREPRGWRITELRIMP